MTRVTWSRAAWTHEAALCAVALRRKGMSYPDIAIAVEHFHDVITSAAAVRNLCRNAGCVSRTFGARGANFRREAA